MSRSALVGDNFVTGPLIISTKLDILLQALAERSSDATVTGGFVSLLSVADKTQTLSIFLMIISEETLLE